MTNVPYNTNIPFASNSPSQDQPRMQENTNSLKSLIEIDHVGFGNNQGGYHQLIHQPIVPVGGQTAWDPVIGSAGRLAIEATAISGVEQLFTLNYTPDTSPASTADTQLFSMTGGGGVSQLTGNSTSDPTEGWCWTGGILLQWGFVSVAASSGTVIFKSRATTTIPFPNNCFGVWMQNTNLSPPGFRIVSKTNLQFQWGSTTALTSFLWFAIGN